MFHWSIGSGSLFHPLDPTTGTPYDIQKHALSGPTGGDLVHHGLCFLSVTLDSGGATSGALERVFCFGARSQASAVVGGVFFLVCWAVLG